MTGVDSTTKLDMMRSIGADHVVDYTQEDFTMNGQRYDLILDFSAHRSIFDYKRALAPKGTYAMVGGSMATFLQTLCLAPWISRTGSKKMGILGQRQNREDLGHLIELLEAGTIVPVIDRRYPLSEVAEALQYLGEGNAQGKIIITFDV